GLGLDAQKDAVHQRLNGYRWQMVAEFVEIESGKRASRPQLDAALAACKKHKAKLIVAKLDREGNKRDQTSCRLARVRAFSRSGSVIPVAAKSHNFSLIAVLTS